MPYCRDCGRELPQDSRFCPACRRDQEVPIPPERGRISTPDVEVPPPPQQPSPAAWVGRGVLIFFGGCCLLPVLLVLLFFGVPLLAGTAGGGAASLVSAVFEEPLVLIMILATVALFIGVPLLVVRLYDRRDRGR